MAPAIVGGQFHCTLIVWGIGTQWVLRLSSNRWIVYRPIDNTYLNTSTNIPNTRPETLAQATSNPPNKNQDPTV
jgi:hypothetical protein